MTNMNYIGLDVHKKTISYCVKDAAGQVLQEGKVGSTRRELDCWIKTLPQPRTIAMEATIFTGWIYDHLLPQLPRLPSVCFGAGREHKLNLLCGLFGVLDRKWMSGSAESRNHKPRGVLACSES
jgi:hypothetical protein